MIASGLVVLVVLAVAANVQYEKHQEMREAARRKRFDEVWGNILKPPPNVTSPPSIATPPAEETTRPADVPIIGTFIALNGKEQGGVAMWAVNAEFAGIEYAWVIGCKPATGTCWNLQTHVRYQFHLMNYDDPDAYHPVQGQPPVDVISNIRAGRADGSGHVGNYFVATQRDGRW